MTTQSSLSCSYSTSGKETGNKEQLVTQSSHAGVTIVHLYSHLYILDIYYEAFEALILFLISLQTFCDTPVHYLNNNVKQKADRLIK